jgi:hypothetical protein
MGILERTESEMGILEMAFVHMRHVAVHVLCSNWYKTLVLKRLCVVLEQWIQAPSHEVLRQRFRIATKCSDEQMVTYYLVG